MELDVTGAFIYFTIPVFGGIPITQTTVSSFLVTVFLIVASIRLGKNLKKRPDGIQVLVEKGVSMLYNMVGESMGEHNLHWAPFIGTIFLSSILGSYIGLTGFLRSSTADLSCVMVWALSVSIIIWYNNIKACQNELKTATNSSQLEKTNLLMKVRESLTDIGKGDNGGTVITIPDGISRYPNNTFWGILRWISWIMFAAGVLLLCIIFANWIEENS